jgi:hypothetical protein
MTGESNLSHRSISRYGFVDLSSGFAIAAAPKVGTLSLIQFLFEIRHGRKPVAGEATHHWITGTPLYRSLQDAIGAGIPIVAVHRDPYERIRSAYQHRVVKEREAVAQSFGAKKQDGYN